MSERPAWGLRLLFRALAGLEVGVLGGLVVLAWFAFDSMWRQQHWWAMLNLAASTLYGERAFRMGLGQATFAGAALHLCVFGGVGALYGLLIPQTRNTSRALLLGLAAGLVWYYFSIGVFWRNINPLVIVYASQPALLSAHVIYGVFLGRQQRVCETLEHHFQRPEPPYNLPPPPPTVI